MRTNSFQVITSPPKSEGHRNVGVLRIFAQPAGERPARSRNLERNGKPMPKHRLKRAARHSRGFGGGAADAFARAVARAERPACKSISLVRHLSLWRSSPRLRHVETLICLERKQPFGGKIGVNNHLLCLYQSMKGDFSLSRWAKRRETLCIFLGNLRR